jgi:hypothetical protein
MALRATDVSLLLQNRDRKEADFALGLSVRLRLLRRIRERHALANTDPRLPP